MNKFTGIALAALVTSALLLGGCGGKSSASQPAAAHGSAAAESAAHGGTAASAQVSAAHGATASEAQTQTSAAGEGKTSPAASAVKSPTATPTAKPTPSPTPKGTVIDGWVVGIPAKVPKFAYGRLDTEKSRIVVQEGRASTVFSLCFRGVKTTDLGAYAALLQQQGFAAAASEIGLSYTMTASYEGKDGSITIVIALTQSDGVAMATFGVPG